jgi:preprotein translocase subunit SecY
MTTTWKDKARLIMKDRMILNKFLYVALGLAVFRLLTVIPIPGVDPLRLESFFQNNQFFGLLNIFSGSGLSTLSVVMLGVGPYITASIIMQLLTMMSSKLKALYHEEGEAGRMRFAQYSRRLSIPLAIVQAFSFLALLHSQGIVDSLARTDLIVNVLVITAGSVFLMWLGELITEYGIGNGVSLIIFAGIVAGIPQAVAQLKYTFDPAQLPMYIGFVVAAIVIVWLVVMVTEAERAIPITYAKRVRGAKVYGGISTYLPLRVNQAGVIPIIFALSILLFPQMIFRFLTSVDQVTIKAASTAVLNFLNNQWAYGVLYFLLVFLFTYFYTAVTFDPKTISENLQKSGAFIPGVRPGGSTEEYLARVVTRITFVGALFLALIAVLPLVMQGLTGNTSLAIGGTALLIVVSVVLDLVKKIGGQIAMREY